MNVTAVEERKNQTYTSRVRILDIDEIERLTSFANTQIRNHGHQRAIYFDLHSYSWIGLFELLSLLLLFKYIINTIDVGIEVILPHQENVLKFLDRWGIFKCLKENEREIILNRISCGRGEKIEDVLAQIGHYNTPRDKTLSIKLMEVATIVNFTEAIEYLRKLCAPKMQGILFNQMASREVGKKDLDKVKEFTDILIFELLKNIIHHVLPKFEEKKVRSLGFVSIQTHNKVHFEKVISTLNSNKLKSESCTALFMPFWEAHPEHVEIIVVDDGFGIKETLKKSYKDKYGKDGSEIEIIKYACKYGTTRFNKVLRDKIIEEFQEIMAECEQIREGREKQGITDSLQVDQLIKDFGEKALSLGRGYGLNKVIAQVEKWNGCIYIRSGCTCYLQDFHTSKREASKENLEHFPGTCDLAPLKGTSS